MNQSDRPENAATKSVDQTDENGAKPRKLLFVIKAKEKSSVGFESFLRNRDWDVVATSDLKMALSALFSRPIHCVLITVEHSNPHCLKLPGIIAQTTKTPVILFAEGLTPGGVNILRGSDHPYILVPPVSGPAIERMVLRIEKERAAGELDRTDSNVVSSSKSPGENATIIQKGNFSAKDYVHLFESDRAESHEPEFDAFDLIDHKSPAPADHVPMRARSAKEFSRLRPDDDASILDRAASASLKAASVLSVATDGTLRMLDRKARVTCIQVDSSFFAGVLVIAFATDRDDTSEFMENFKTFLMGFLNDEGVTTSMYDVPDFCLNDVSFEDWSIADASFMRKAIHHNGEIGLSFFHHDVDAQPLKPSEDVTMSRIELNEIREDVALAFDVYLYLPVNKKYIRYAAKERFLYDSQRERLDKGGVKDMHIKRDSEKDVARYRLQIGLNDKLRNYAGKKGA